MAGGVIQYVLRVRDQASDAIDSAADAADDLDISLAGLSEAALAASAALAGVAFGLNEIISATNETILEIDRLSERTGVSRESIAGMQLALEGAGLEASEVAGLLEPLAERIADAAMGSEDAALGFKRLGVEILNTDGSMRSTEAVLRDTIDALSQIENPTERAAAAMFSIQEAGAALTTALGGNSQALDRFIDQAKRLGPELSDPAVDSARRIEAAYAQLGLTLDSIGQQITNSLGQAFGGDTEALIGAVRLSIQFLVEQIGRGVIVFSEFFGMMKRDLVDLAEVLFMIKSFEFSAAADILKNNEQERQRAVAAIGEQLQRDISNELEEQEKKLQSTLTSIILSAEALQAGQSIEARAVPTPSDQLFAPPPDESEAATAEAVQTQTVSFLDGLNSLGNEINAGLDELSAGLEAALSAPFDRITNGIAALGGDFTAQFNVLTQIGSFMPGVSGAIVSAVSAIGDFGARLESEGAEEVARDTFRILENIAAFFENLPDFLSELPNAFGKAVNRLIASIPQFLIGLVQRLPEAIGDGLLRNTEFFENLISALVDIVIELPFAIARALLVDLPRAIGNAIREIFSFGDGGGVGGFFESIGDRFRELGSDIRSFYGGSRQSGGFVDKTGMYLLHQGEYVSPGNNAAPRSAQEAIAGGPRVSVSVSAAVVDPDVERRLVERIRNSLSSYGRGYSLTPVI